MRAARKPLSIRVRESYSGQSALRVDREAGIIYGAKVLGKSSPNTHGKAGVKGTDYLPSAHQSLISLIEGLRVNKNHTEKSNPNRDRTVGERIGWLTNPTIRGDETFADLHLLKSDPDSAKIFEAAERNPKCFALSINADGHYEIRSNRLTIDRFSKAHSVDVVADGGSTISLAESQGHAMTIREALEKIGLSEENIARVFEADALKPDMAIAPAKADADADAPKGWRAVLADAIKAVLEDTELDEATAKEKIEAILEALSSTKADEGDGVSEIMGGGADDDAGTTDVEEADDANPFDDKKDDDMSDDDKKKKEKAVAESRELQQLREEKNVRRLCESLKFTPSETQVKAMVTLTEAERKAFVAELTPETKKPGSTGSPRTGGITRTQESFGAPKDAAEQARQLVCS